MSINAFVNSAEKDLQRYEFLEMIDHVLSEIGEAGIPEFLEGNSTRVAELSERYAAAEKATAAKREAEDLSRADRHVLARSHELASKLTTTAQQRLSARPKREEKPEEPRVLTETKRATAAQKALRHEALYRDARRKREQREREKLEKDLRERSKCTFEPRACGVVNVSFPERSATRMRILGTR